VRGSPFTNIVGKKRAWLQKKQKNSVGHADGIFSDVHREAFAALRASHGVLALFLGQAERNVAMLTFAVYVGLSVAEFVPLHFEKSRELAPHLQKGAVFLLTPIDVAGKKAEHIERDQDQLKDPKHDAFEKNIDQQYDEIDPEQGTVELVVAVSSIHEANKAIGKFCFLHDISLLVRS
jgi:hypothetical protein